jgi:hypothetical protein
MIIPVRGLALILLMTLTSVAHAHDLVIFTGYAASEKPSSGAFVAPNDFSSGGGYIVGGRLDFETSRYIWIAPSLLYWDNITGGQTGLLNSHYSQFQIGARVLIHTLTVPKFFLGGGVDFAAAQGVVKAGRIGPTYGKGETVREYTGEVPVGVVVAGFKGQAPNGIGIMADVAYHFGLDESVGRQSIGPASVIMLRIGFFLRDERSPNR